jgi:hypothetical protein
MKKTQENNKMEPEAKPNTKPKIDPVKRFAFIVLLFIFVPATIYFMATLQFLAFFILVVATFVIIQILNWKFKEE